MSERIFLRLGYRLALGADSLQWILYKSRAKAGAPSLWKAAATSSKCGGDGLECGREVRPDQFRAGFAHLKEGGGDQYGDETIFDGREPRLIVDKAGE